MVVTERGGSLEVAVSQVGGSSVIKFGVGGECVGGTCDCVHMIAGERAQLRPCRLFAELFYRGDTDPDWQYLIMGVVFGFRVINPSFRGNYSSGRKGRMKQWESDLIESKLKSELEGGMLTVVKDRPRCTHGIFVVPKDDGGGRAVVDCSKPDDVAVNNFTSEVSRKFSYLGVDDVVEMLEVGDWLAAIDIKDAYRAVAIHPEDRDRQGISWLFKGEAGETFFVDNRLCMGLSSSPYVFSKLSDFVVRCALREGVDRAVNYLDDFCLLGRSEQEVGEAQIKVVAILRRLGFFISFKKLTAPCTKLRFLGIYIDAERLELTLPEDKLVKLRGVLGEFKGRRKASRKELERLGGLLAHCAKVVRGGRTFSRRIYDMIGTLRYSHFKVRLSSGFREDVIWWDSFVGDFNGKAGMIGGFSPMIAVYSDASNWGAGATHGNDWLVGAFEEKVDTLLGRYVGHHHQSPDVAVGSAHINIKEMWAAFAGASRWGGSWLNSTVIFVTDSAVVQGALNSGRSRSPEIMGFLRKLFWLSVKNNFYFVSTYIHTSVNTTCDALSRLDKLDSVARIRGVDVAQKMCCAQIFEVPFPVFCRTVGAGSGTEGV